MGVGPSYEVWEPHWRESHAGKPSLRMDKVSRRARAESRWYAVALALAVAGSAGTRDRGLAALQEGQSKVNSKVGQRAAPAKTILIQRDLIEPLGEIPLVNFNKFSLQLHLNKLATTGSKDRVLQMRAYLRDIFAEAVDQDFLVKDPARKVKVPAQLRPTDTTTLTWDQLRLTLSKLNLRDRILLELDMTNALRPSELFAFRWKRFDHKACTLTVAETVYKGNIRDWGKTKKSLTVIHIPKDLADDLQAWRLKCEERAREAAAKHKTKSPHLSSERLHLRKRSWSVLGHGQFSQAVSPQTRSRSQVAEADLPGHSENDCDLGSEEGHGEGRAGCHAAFSYGHHDGCIHARNSGKCAIDDQFDQPGTARFSG